MKIISDKTFKKCFFEKDDETAFYLEVRAYAIATICRAGVAKKRRSESADDAQKGMKCILLS